MSCLWKTILSRYLQLFELQIFYIELTKLQELNIRTLTVTAEEDKYGVRYKLMPEWKVLGQAFKKDAGKIRAELNNVDDAAIKKFIASKTIKVAGFDLTEEHLQVTRYFDDAHSSYQAHFTSEVLVILDTALDEGLVKEGIAREVVNRIQRLRKKSNLQPIDDIHYYVKVTQDPKDELKSVLKELKEVLDKYLKQDIHLVTEDKEGDTLIIREEQEVNMSLF